MTDDEDGGTKPKLRPANENSWYVLATLHGEESDNGSGWYFNEKLLAKNRLDWNKWASSTLGSEQREFFAKITHADGKRVFSEDELTPHTEYQLSLIKNLWMDAYKNRNQKFLPHDGSVLFPDPKEIIDFDLVFFNKFLNLSGFLFVNETRFKGVKFAHATRFDKAVFYKTARFFGSDFVDVAGFRGAMFFNFALFDNSKMRSTSSFKDTIFKNSPPKFHGATLHEATEWHGAAWPEPPADAETAQQHVYNYERLKQEMERLKKHDDELDFFAREMRARRVVDGKWSPKGLVNAGYDWLSAYGRSLARPFWLLLVSLLLGVIIENSAKTGGALLTTAEAYGLSAANTLAILPFVKDAVSRADLSATMNIVGVMQGALGALFLFLIGLALRNRFRLK